MLHIQTMTHVCTYGSDMDMGMVCVHIDIPVATETV